MFSYFILSLICTATKELLKATSTELLLSTGIPVTRDHTPTLKHVVIKQKHDILVVFLQHLMQKEVPGKRHFLYHTKYAHLLRFTTSCLSSPFNKDIIQFEMLSLSYVSECIQTLTNVFF